MKKQTKTFGTESSKVTHESKAPCSISLTRDAKGNLKWDIKIYCESEDLEAQAKRILDIDKQIREDSKNA